jgi:4'-phosphopantetheinyl transferase EntD
LGVDVEARGRDTTAVAARILRPEERAALGGLPHDWATLWFCVKESVYKALHPVTGVYLGFQDARVHLPQSLPALAADGGGTLDWELLKACGAEFPVGTTGRAGWSAEGRWLVAGVWLEA